MGWVGAPKLKYIFSETSIERLAVGKKWAGKIHNLQQQRNLIMWTKCARLFPYTAIQINFKASTLKSWCFDLKCATP